MTNDDIELRLVTEHDRPQVTELFRKFFFPDEPLTGSSEPEGNGSNEEEEFILKYIKYGTCIIAIDKKTDKAVGVCLAGPQRENEAEHLFRESAEEGNTTWGNILRLLACIERDAQVMQKYNVKRILYIIGTCVDSSMRGRDIGARLYNAVRDLGKAKGYQLLRADCTSYYSAKIKDKLGWDCINIVNYNEYLDDKGKPVFSPAAPHVCCKSYALRL
ncbi:arylalkylamine N-acetyltransferase-like 2 [Haematobia irritans]|uniref:arylalkylamine N-acetyltransferase-like 2 n=1 Tax=Haematobia irritans TaxID=7368 RepID=UPI003F501B04